MADRAEYPQHDKLHEVKERSQTIGEFMEWLGAEKKLCLATWANDNWMLPAPYDIQDLLAEFFEIDRNALEAEKLHMLEAQRALNARAAEQTA